MTYYKPGEPAVLRDMNKDDQLQREYRAFRGNTVGVVLRFEDRALAHQFKKEEEAQHFIDWLAQQGFFKPSDAGTLEPVIEMFREQTVFAVILTDDIIDNILGKGHFENEAVVTLQRGFLSCIVSGRIEKIHLVLATEYFANNASLQKRFLASLDELDNPLLQTAIIEFSSDNFTLFIKTIANDVLQEAMLMQNGHQQSALAFAMTITYNNAFEQLLTRATDNTLQQAIEINPEILPAIFTDQSSAVMAAFLQRRIAFDAIKPLLTPDLLMPKNLQQTTLAFAITITYKNDFEQLLAFAADDMLKQASETNPKILPAIFADQSPAVITAFLQLQMALDAIKPLITPRLTSQFADCILYDAHWQHPDVIAAVFYLVGKTIAPMIYQAWIQGHEISAALKQATLANQGNTSFAEEKAFIQYEPSTNEALFAANAFHHITTGKNQVIELEKLDANHIATIKQDGFASIQDYRILRKIQSNVPGALRETLDALYYTGNLSTGIQQNPANALEEKNVPTFDEIHTLVADENALLQKIPLDKLDDIIAQLTDYTYRPHHTYILSAPPIYKFFHLKNKIEEYKPQVNGIHQYTQQWPMNHITSACNNAIAGENENARALVYLLHNKQHGVIKAMLNHSHVTRNRSWIGNKRDVEDYADNQSTSNKTHFAAFNQEAKEQPYRLNKVLFKTKREAVQAIVIPQDTPIARQVARLKALEFAAKNMPVAIVFYDRILHQFRPYLAEEIALDLANDKAEALRQAIQEKSEEEFIAYFDTLDNTDLSALLLHQSAPNAATALHLAAQKYPDKALHLMLAKLASNEREIALLELTNDTGQTVLHTVLQYQSNIVDVVNLLRLSTIEAKMAADKHNYAYILFHAATYCSEPNLIAFVRYLSQTNNHKVLEKAFVVQDEQHRSALYLAAEKLTPDHFEKLFEILPVYILSEACKVEIQINHGADINEFKGDKIEYLTLLNAMIEHQSIENIITLLSTIYDSAFDYLLFREDREEACNALIQQIIAGLLQEEVVEDDDTVALNAWLDKRFILRLLNHPKFSPILIKKIEDYWFEGNEIAEKLQSLVQHYLRDQPSTALNKNLHEFKNYMAEDKEDHLFLTSKKNRFRLNENRENLLKLIWTEGLYDIQDYRLLRKHYCHLRGMSELLDNLRNLNAITTGLSIPYQLDVLDIEQFNETAAQERLLALQEKINKANLSTFSLFGKGAKPTPVIAIELQIQNAKDKRQNWTAAETAINTVLNKAEKTMWDYQATEQFYQAAREHMTRKQ